MLAPFILVETLQKRPMLDLSLFTYPRFLGAQALPLATGFGFVVPLVILPARFIGVEGMGEIEVGLMLLPLCLPIAIVPLAGAFIARWIPAATLAAIGLTLAAAGLAWLAVVPPGAARAAFVGPLMLIGIGSGLTPGSTSLSRPSRRCGSTMKSGGWISPKPSIPQVTYASASFTDTMPSIFISTSLPSVRNVQSIVRPVRLEK